LSIVFLCKHSIRVRFAEAVNCLRQLSSSGHCSSVSCASPIGPYNVPLEPNLSDSAADMIDKARSILGERARRGFL
jgi:hypothetical protein